MKHFSFLVFFYVCWIPLIAAEENFLLIDGMTDEILYELGNNHQQVSPCSTFKIPLSLIGYDAEILKDEKSPTWDFQEGYEEWIAYWKTPQSPESWMKYSCVWYSKILSLELGLKKIQNYLNSFEYGNQDVSSGLALPGPARPFWINTSLQISPKEQVQFLQKMLRGQLPISPTAIHMTRAILYKEEFLEKWTLFGKTGWSGSEIAQDGKCLEHGWFVGWIEKDHRFYSFAYLIRDKKIQLDQRIPRVKTLLSESGVITER